MVIIHDINEIQLTDKTAVAIGKFDGIHCGHQLLIQKIIDKKKEGFKSLVFTFEPSPQAYFTGKEEKLITTSSEKYSYFEEKGIDFLLVFGLNEQTASVSAEDFVMQILLGKLNCGYIVAGSDLSFGKGGKGNIALIESLALQYGFQTEKIDKICIDDKEVSSTYIKKLIEAGNIVNANRFLGHPYQINGQVAAGKQLGRKLGFPTANVYVDKIKQLPLYGVYYTKTLITGNEYNSITNIGVKPSVTDENIPLAETYILDYSDDLYGMDITIQFVDFRRAEQKFTSIKELELALKEDIKAANQFFGN